MVDDNKILILMSTYNGEKYIKEQIESIVRQSYTNWFLLIRDDGSTDDTVKIVVDFMSRDSRITREDSYNKNLGAKNSFAYLMEKAIVLPYDYYMFCDQDDVWFNDKVELQLRAMKCLEETHGKNLPFLVFSDLISTDDKLKPLPRMDMTKITNSGESSFAAKNIIHGVSLGCTMLINKSLLKLSIPVPIFEIMHDSWLESIARVFGRLDYLSVPTMYYRRHSTSLTDFSRKHLFQRLLRNFHNNRMNYACNKAFGLLKIAADCSNDTKRILQKYVELRGQNKINRLITVARYKMYPNSLIRFGGWVLLLLLTERVKSHVAYK